MGISSTERAPIGSRRNGNELEGAACRLYRRVLAAGNALRDNAVLRECVRDAFGLPLFFTRHREEAAFGAALTAAVGAGLFPSLDEAARLITYE